jgi:hypothetical protein
MLDFLKQDNLLVIYYKKAAGYQGDELPVAHI